MAGRDAAAHDGTSLRPVAATLLALAGIREGEVVVDAGCGTGLLTHPAAAAAGPAGRAYGVDDDAALLAHARDRRPSDARWLRAAPDRLPLRTGSVDKVLCGSVLHRLPDVRPVLAEWARVLAPGGRVAVSAWEALDEDVPYAAVRQALAGAPHTAPRDLALTAGGTAYAAADLPGLLAAAGLVPGHVLADDVTLAFPDGAAYARWRLAFPATAPYATPAVAARATALAGDAPVLAGARIRYVTASART